MLIKSQNGKALINPGSVRAFYIDKADNLSYPPKHEDENGNRFSIYADGLVLGSYKTEEDAINELNDFERGLHGVDNRTIKIF